MPKSEPNTTAAEDLKNTFIAEINAKIAFKAAYDRLLAKHGPDYFKGIAQAKEITERAYSEFVNQMSPEARTAYFSRTPDQAAREAIAEWSDAGAGMTPGESSAYQEDERLTASLGRAAGREADSWESRISARQESERPMMFRKAENTGSGGKPPSWGHYDMFGNRALKDQARRDALR